LTAELFVSRSTEPARPATPGGGDDHFAQPVGDSGDLVTGHERQLDGRLAVLDVQIAVANAAGEHANCNLVCVRLGVGKLLDRERSAELAKHGRAHRVPDFTGPRPYAVRENPAP
jgi:hypothetical protein